MTFPAWSTLLTGVNPGKHGIFDFTERIPGKLQVRFLNATRRRFPSFLRLASDQGWRVGSIALPTTYPPEPLSGFQLSGFDTPLPSKADSSYVYPRELAAKIERELGGYYFGDFNEARIGKAWHRRVLGQLFAGLERKQKLVQLLLRERPVDLLLVHVGETDTVGHHYWSFYDFNSPRFTPTEDAELPSAIERIYAAADHLVGELLALTQPETVLIVSDHGMGGTSDRVLYLNNYLAACGLLNWRAERRNADRIGMLKQWGMRWLPYRWQQQVFRWAGGRLAANLESRQRFSGIDWSQTVAYSEELNYFPAIYLNVAGREPAGVIAPDEVGARAAEVSAALLEWRDPLTDERIVRAVRCKEELYSGAETIFAPDIILELKQPGGYSYALGKSAAEAPQTVFRQLKTQEYLGYKGASMNGAHRRQGTLIVRSEREVLALPDEPSLLDVAPSALTALNVEVPDWMEGRSFFSGARVVNSQLITSAETQPLSPAEEANLRRRLLELGYLD